MFSVSQFLIYKFRTRGSLGRFFPRFSSAFWLRNMVFRYEEGHGKRDKGGECQAEPIRWPVAQEKYDRYEWDQKIRQKNRFAEGMISWILTSFHYKDRPSDLSKSVNICPFLK